MKLVTFVLSVAFVCAFASENQQHGREEADYLKAALVVPPDMKKSRIRRSTAIVERPGNSVESHDCGRISSIPNELRQPMHMYPKGLDVFYQKYTHAYGIPIVGSSKVSDTALQRACYMVRFTLADRPDVRESFYKMFGRMALMAYNEMTTDIPEHSHMEPVFWDARARGLGATRGNPVSTGGEENAACLKNDRYPHEDIILHEFVHGVHLIGAQFAIEGFDDRLKALYNSAKAKGLWDNTYAMTNHIEYWAEVVQSYFNDNGIARPANGIHNDIYNRAALKDYDPDVYALIEEIWPCKNTFLTRCLSSRELEQAQVLKMNCNGTENKFFSYDKSCADSHFSCPDWANRGECSSNPNFMLNGCKRSCWQCGETYRGRGPPDISHKIHPDNEEVHDFLASLFHECGDEANKGSASSVTPLTSCTDVANDCSSPCTSDIKRSTQECRKTCTNCQWYINLLNPAACENENGSCAAWAKMGECEKNPGYMLKGCRKSCNVC